MLVISVSSFFAYQTIAKTKTKAWSKQSVQCGTGSNPDVAIGLESLPRDLNVLFKRKARITKHFHLLAQHILFYFYF